MEHPSKTLKRHKLFPTKHLSQNFLINTHSLEGTETFFQKNDVILEIGPGLGAVTDYFLLHKFPMILCEKDRELAKFLEKKYHKENESVVIHHDFLDVAVEHWHGRGITACVSNLPFHITTEIILRIIKQMTFVKNCLWGVQKEVATRLCTDKKSSSLSLFIQIHGNIRLENLIKKNSFYPKPKVDACWVYWERAPKIEMQDSELFEILLRSAFWGKRKTVMNALKRSPHLQKSITSEWLKKVGCPTPKIEVLMQRRADALNIEDYLTIFKWLRS